MPATYYATFEYADTHPDGTRSESFGYFDSVSLKTYESICDATTITSFSKSEKELELAVWQVNVGDVIRIAPDFLDNDKFVVWWAVEVDDQPSKEGGIPATFVSLVAGGNEQNFRKFRIVGIRPAEEEQTQKLGRFFSANGFKSCKAEQIEHILSAACQELEALHVAVYDMGQANCNAIVDDYEHPRLFFDLGWPIQINSKTAPHSRPLLFNWEKRKGGAFKAPVILSHWDWDHWAYALHTWKYDHSKKAANIVWNDEALERQWLIPRPSKEQKLGPSHWALFIKLYTTRLGRKRVLNLWPNSALKIDFKFGSIVRCTPKSGSIGDRNNSGLALYVREMPLEHWQVWSLLGIPTELILLPGDADFSSIPRLAQFESNSKTQANEALVGLVASHHGGKVNVYAIPETTIPQAKLAISSGKGNAYKHPNQQAILNYKYKGWSVVVSTENRKMCTHSKRCSDHNSNSIVLQFSTSSRKPRCGCGAIPEGFLCLN